MSPRLAIFQLPFIAFPECATLEQIVLNRGIFAAKRLCAKLRSIR